jgi:type II secretory pathway pseudopilin PulG
MATILVLRTRLRDETGSMLLELVIAMMFLAVAGGALISTYSSGILSLRHASIEGNALTLVDRQIELYNTLPYASIKLDSATIPGSTDPYVTANSSDATIPNSTGQVVGATVTSGSCTAPTTPQASCATQTVTGPDGRTYRVDTYIVSVTPSTSGSRAVKQITAIARLVTGGTPGPLRARLQSSFDPCNPPTTTTGTSC